MKVGIANDLKSATEILRRVVTSQREHSIAWTAENGYEAIQCCQRDLPDVVLMDLVMPVMDGVEATRQIMEKSPCPILVVTSDVSRNFQMVCEAMGHGAYDAVCLPRMTGTPEECGADLLERMKRASRARKHLQAGGVARGSLSGGPAEPADQEDSDFISRKIVVPQAPAPGGNPPSLDFPLLAIGSSTGGPQALDSILSKLPAKCPAAIVIAQHIGPGFADSLAEWLGQRAKIKVRTIRPGDVPQPGVALIAATSDHLVLRKDGTFGYTAEPAGAPYRPSVNALFFSLHTYWRRPGIAVLLTGIGTDGAEGMLALRQAGWFTIAQDQATSVVYGMPQAAAQMNAAIRILPVQEMADYLTNRLSSPAPLLLRPSP
jgi:chemotaxis response regulator CheB